MASLKRNIKRIICIILLVVFSPFILLYLLIKTVTKRARKRTWKKKGLSGKQLLLASTMEDIDKMENFELMDYFKYLFFYDGYNTKSLSNSGKSAQYLLSRNGEEYLLRFSIVKNHKDQKVISELMDEKQARNIEKAIFITNREIDKSIKNDYFEKMIRILDRTELETFATRVVEKIKSNTSNIDMDGKNMSEMLDIMYPNRI